jgi:hypothetical protein
VRTGQPSAKATLGADSLWSYIEGNPLQQKIFNAAMTSYTSLEIDAVLACYDFAGITSLVDIGGSLGRHVPHSPD